MSKRSIRKHRHRPDYLDWLQTYKANQLKKQLANGDINYSQVPWPHRDTLGNDVPDDVIEVAEEHVHSEHCNHS